MKNPTLASPRFPLLLLCALTALATACGNDNGGSTPPANEQPGTVPEVIVTIAAGASSRAADAFGENPLVVQRGTKVTWVNNDAVAHTATSNTGLWNSGSIPPGGSYSHVFSDPGDFAYSCTIHPQMQGTLRVQGESPGTAPTPTPAPQPTVTPSPAPTTTPSPSPSPAPTVTVNISAGSSTRTSDAFGTNPLIISKGTTVTWVNNDTLPHTTTSGTGVWSSGTLEPGSSFSRLFDSAGTFPYACGIHPNMTGVIMVE